MDQNHHLIVPKMFYKAWTSRKHFSFLWMTKGDQSIFDLCERKENAWKISGWSAPPFVECKFIYECVDLTQKRFNQESQNVTRTSIRTSRTATSKMPSPNASVWPQLKHNSFGFVTRTPDEWALTDWQQGAFTFAVWISLQMSYTHSSTFTFVYLWFTNKSMLNIE